MASRAAIQLTRLSKARATARPAYLASRNWPRLTGLASTASAVPLRISRATEADALMTAPNNPAISVTASALILTSFGSSPNPK